MKYYWIITNEKQIYNLLIERDRRKSSFTNLTIDKLINTQKKERIFLTFLYRRRNEKKKEKL